MSTRSNQVALSAARDGLAVAGAVANLAALAAFSWGALSLWGMSKGYVAAAGGLPRPSLSWLMEAWRMGGVESRAFYLAAAWACAVAAAGCAWMSVLGGRWAYHAASRLLNRAA